MITRISLHTFSRATVIASRRLNLLLRLEGERQRRCPGDEEHLTFGKNLANLNRGLNATHVRQHVTRKSNAR